MEKLIAEALCPGSAVRVINCNGDHVSLEAIAKRIGTLARLVHKRFRPIVVLIDREQRQFESSKIKQELLTLLQKEQIDAPVVLGVADRMVENWILADSEALERIANIKVSVPQNGFEGTCGEVRLKDLLPESVTYVKTIHGVQWFTSCDAEKLRQNSASFRDFANELSGVNCRWLDQKRLL